MRPRHYVSRTTLVLASPVFRYSQARDAYILRAAGRRVGPVLRLDRRGRRRVKQPYSGLERREALSA